MTLVQIEQVSHRFGAVTSLHELQLEIRKGEVFGLLGPNGAGKTTALRILCGLLAPDAGRVLIGGIDIHAQPLLARRQFSFVPDGAPLYANLSPRQHLRLVGRLREMPEASAASE